MTALEASETVEHTPHQQRGGHLAAVLAIVITTVLFAAMVAVLYYKFLKTTPVAKLVVEGDEHFEGAVIVVENLNDPSSVFRQTMDKSRQYICTFRISPGAYLLRMEPERGLRFRIQIENFQHHPLRLRETHK